MLSLTVSRKSIQNFIIILQILLGKTVIHQRWISLWLMLPLTPQACQFVQYTGWCKIHFDFIKISFNYQRPLSTKGGSAFGADATIDTTGLQINLQDDINLYFDFIELRLYYHKSLCCSRSEQISLTSFLYILFQSSGYFISKKICY